MRFMLQSFIFVFVQNECSKFESKAKKNKNKKKKQWTDTGGDVSVSFCCDCIVSASRLLHWSSLDFNRFNAAHQIQVPSPSWSLIQIQYGLVQTETSGPTWALFLCSLFFIFFFFLLLDVFTVTDS